MTISHHIRWMIRRDMAEVIDIEQASFSDPMIEEDFIFKLRERHTIGMVCEQHCQVNPHVVTKAVVGFMLYEIDKTSYRLFSVAVDPMQRGYGIGRLLLSRMEERATKSKRRRIEATVRETNLDAQLFLRACGWRAVQVIRDAYDHSDEHAYRFIKRIQSLQEVEQ